MRILLQNKLIVSSSCVLLQNSLVLLWVYILSLDKNSVFLKKELLIQLFKRLLVGTIQIPTKLCPYVLIFWIAKTIPKPMTLWMQEFSV